VIHIDRNQLLATDHKVMKRQGRRCKQLLDKFNEAKKYRKLKEEALDHTAENSLWKKLWTCRKTDCGMDE
jgi:hypothetical protein